MNDDANSNESLKMVIIWRCFFFLIFVSCVFVGDNLYETRKYVYNNIYTRKREKEMRMFIFTIRWSMFFFMKKTLRYGIICHAKTHRRKVFE